MGLGKTFIATEKMKSINNHLTIVICPKSVIPMWKEHFQKNYPEYDVYVCELPINIYSPSVIIINYDLAWRRKELLDYIEYTLILDESQFIKNSTAKRTKIVQHLKYDSLILLSGTPTGGKYEELLTQCNLLGWKISKKTFWEMYINYILIDVGGFKIPKVIGYKNVEHLKNRLAQYGAVFMKTEEAIELPEHVDNIIKIKNTKDYLKFKKDRMVNVQGHDLVGDTSLTRLLYLRQLASQYNKNKLEALQELIESTNDRIIIFYNFTEERKQIQKTLKRPVSVVAGDEKNLKNYEEKSDSVTLVQYQAGATGLNLQKANKIIYYGLPLSSDLFEQSKARIRRIGQARTCFYYYLITENSIEEKILETLKQRKDYTDELFKKEDI